MSVFGSYPSAQWAQDITSRGKDPCLDFWAQDFTPKIEVKMHAFEVKIRASEVKSWARKSRQVSLPREVNSWAHWAEGYDPRVLVMVNC